MNDFAVGVGQDDSEPPSGFAVGATVRMNYRVMVRTDGGEWVPLDLSLARWSVRVRAWRAGATAFIRDEEATKSATAAADGYVDHPFMCGATAYASSLEWRLVLVDASNADASSKTLKQETTLLEWRAPIPAAPRTGP